MRLRRRRELVCREVVELVSDYLDGVLAPPDRERFERHLTGCDGCSAYLEQVRATLRIAGSLAPDDLDRAMRDRLVEAFRGWSAGA